MLFSSLIIQSNFLLCQVHHQLICDGNFTSIKGISNQFKDIQQPSGITPGEFQPALADQRITAFRQAGDESVQVCKVDGLGYRGVVRTGVSPSSAVGICSRTAPARASSRSNETPSGPAPPRATRRTRSSSP